MTRKELLQLIAEIQQHQSELDDVEIKSAQRGTPKRLYESLSAFANRTGGGVILLGLKESGDFGVVGVCNAHRLQEEISHLASSEMEPPLRVKFTVETVERKTIVVVEVPEVPPQGRPCYYKPAGLQKGSYIRVGNTNRKMTDYEIFGYVSSRAQPTFDEEPIREAEMEDLDREKLDEYLATLRKTRPQAGYLSRPFEQVLRQLRIVRKVNGVWKPTLAGLLVFGKYPQTFEPQMVITFVQYYGTSEDQKTPRGERFLDNKKFEGSIPDMVESAGKYVMASIRKSSLIEGLYRRDIPEYPEEALREAVVNAVAHRDYSQFVRGSYIQIRLFADRLEIQSPGGLFGNVTEDTLEEEQSTRNRVLMRLLEDLHLVENRGSGIQAMIGAMRQANLEPPRFTDKRTSFWVVFRSHTLMSPKAIKWLNQFAGLELNDRQRVALAYLRLNERITNSVYRRLNRVDTVVANRELRGLLQQGLVAQHGTKRWAEYTLCVPAEAETPTPPARKTAEEAILAYVRKHGWIDNEKCRGVLGVDKSKSARAWYLLMRMCDKGLLIRKGRKRWTRYVLP